VPDRAGLLARIVNTEVPEPDTVDGLHVAEARAGRPARVSEIVPVKPCSAETVTLSERLLPAGPAALSEKRRERKVPT
jgi:hypothetical protein